MDRKIIINNLRLRSRLAWRDEREKSHVGELHEYNPSEIKMKIGEIFFQKRASFLISYNKASRDRKHHMATREDPTERCRQQQL